MNFIYTYLRFTAGSLIGSTEPIYNNKYRNIFNIMLQFLTILRQNHRINCVYLSTV